MQFATTHWSAVLAARLPGSLEAQAALAELCRAYWTPVFAYLRREGHDHHAAEDLAQAFFERLLRKNLIASADPAKGRFRSFLLTALKHFVADERDKSQTLKRGGGLIFVSFDALPPEQRQWLEPVEHSTAETAFERQWAWSVLERSRNRLREEYVAAAKVELYDWLRCLEGVDGETPSYPEAAAALHLTEVALRSAAYRYRRRHLQLVRDEVTQTIGNAAEVDAELRHLISVLQ